ncbi:MAG: DUF2258 domain-containing protein [Thermosphaera sp.]|nr:DUF2258 domain-containing protein [Thermosphaera sp.]
MPTLRSGLIPAALFADKLRRVLFGQLRDYTKKDKEFANRIPYYSALLNRALFTLLVDELKVDKLDVVRITIDYDVDEEHKEVKWKWDTLKVEVFKRVPLESYAETLKTFIAKAPEIATGVVKYNVEKIGETFDGDQVYAVKTNGKEVGAAVVVLVDENTLVLKKAAVIEPTYAIFDKVKLEIAGRNIEDVLKDQLGKVMQAGKHVSYDEALKTINAIRSKVEAKPIEKPPELEYEGEA